MEEWASYYGANHDELHLPFNFSFLGIEWNARAIRQLVELSEAVVPPGAWPNYVLGNHDEPRVASRFGVRQARTAMLLLLTLRGTPTLYYGDELGMINVDIPPERIQDPQEKNVSGVGLGRDPARTPMQWNGMRVPMPGSVHPMSLPGSQLLITTSRSTWHQNARTSLQC